MSGFFQKMFKNFPAFYMYVCINFPGKLVVFKGWSQKPIQFKVWPRSNLKLQFLYCSWMRVLGLGAKGGEIGQNKC